MQVDPAFDTAVFLGPSLALSEAQALLPAIYFPPIRHGDLYRLRASGIRKFVIIDGVFDHTTPIWHREILLLLREGCSIVGAASMGALRAFELKPYGMRGFGHVYQWYVDGVINGDDEVSLFHTDETMNFAALSQPLVNIRYNLPLAEAQGVLSASNHRQILDRLKQTYFGDRLPASIYTELTDAERAPLKKFFDQQWIDVKTTDAAGVLQAVADGLLDEPFPAEAEWLTRDTWNGAELSMPVTYGACLIDDSLADQPAGVPFMQPHLPLLETLSSRMEDYEAEYQLAVQDFFLRQCLSALDCSTDPVPGAPGLSEVEPDAMILARNGLTSSDWRQQQRVQIQIEQALSNILKTSNALVNGIHADEGHANESHSNESHSNESPADESHDHSDLLAAARTIAIGDWAQKQGYPCEPRGAVAAPQDYCDWVLQTGPVRLGFNWDPVVAVFQRLQFDDRIAELLPC
jgi:hypothetical protein